MNCEEFERTALLDTTGELSAGQRDALVRHLDECPACRSFVSESRRLVALARDVLPAGEPTRAALARIREAAETRPPAYGTIFRPALQVFALAATVLIVAGVWFALTPNRPVGEPVADLNAAWALVTPETETVSGTSAPGTEPADHAARVQALARQLLEMEGFGGEDFGGRRDLVSPSGARVPTATRVRSTSGSRAGICG